MPMIPVDTAVQIVMGPLIDDVDFKTRETAVAYNATGMDVILIKSAMTGVPTQTAITPTTAGANDWVTLADGYYYLELTAAQNNVEGELIVAGHATGVLPWRSAAYNVVPVTVWNSLIAGSDALQIDVAQWLGSVPNAMLTGRVDTSVSVMQNSIISSNTFVAGAINAAAIAPDAIDADALAADALTEIFTKIWTTQLTEAYAADNTAPTAAQALFLAQQMLMEFAIAGVTLTVKKLDGLTTAATFTLNSATVPTSISRAT